MTFLAPGYLWAAMAVAAGIVGLHFIVTRQPHASVLPTARFVPDSPATAVVRDARPADLLLMLLRVLVVFAAGAALAKPVIQPTKSASARIVLVDVSRATRNISEAADSAKALYRDGDAIIAFDSSARSFGPKARDSLNIIQGVDAVGNISAALIAALREGSKLRDRVDSIELVIVSPFVAEEHDEATDSIRKLWPGGARLVRIAAARDSAVSVTGGISLRADPADPLAVTVSITDKSPLRATARIVRSGLISADDSAWAQSGPNVLVMWPASERPRLTVARNPADQSGGLTGRGARVVAAFDRHWMFSADSLRSVATILRWADGEPAAVEKKVGSGCIRFVAIPVPAAGDLVIRPEFVDLVQTLTARCGEPHSFEPLAPSIAASLAGGNHLAPAEAFTARQDLSSPLSSWLLGLAIVAAVAELIVRRRGLNVTDATRPAADAARSRGATISAATS